MEKIKNSIVEIIIIKRNDWLSSKREFGLYFAKINGEVAAISRKKAEIATPNSLSGFTAEQKTLNLINKVSVESKTASAILLQKFDFIMVSL